MENSPKKKKEEPVKFEGTFEDFIKKALQHEPMHKIKKKDKVVTKQNSNEVYIVLNVHEEKGKVEVKKENSDETLEFNEDDLLILE